MFDLFFASDGKLIYDGTIVSACAPEILQLYYRANSPISKPDALDIGVKFEGGFSISLHILLVEFSYRKLHAKEPLISCPNAKSRSLFDEYLAVLLREAVLSLPSKNSAGIFFDHLGWTNVPDEESGSRPVYVYGHRLIGACTRDFCVSPELPALMCYYNENALCNLIDALAESSPVVVQMAGYIALTALRSPVIESGCNLQAVGYVYGVRGLGKTTLAQRLAAFVKPEGSRRACNFFDASSTPAALRDTMVLYRDIPLIVDDFCYSAGRRNEERRIETAAQLLRQASNDTLISKKAADGQTREMYCGAGVIMTAEFTLQNESDVDRCIFFPIRKTPKIDDRIQPELLHEAVLEMNTWFAENHQDALQHLNWRIEHSELPKQFPNMGLRMITNFEALGWALGCLLDAAKANSVSEKRLKIIVEKFQRALEKALRSQLDALEAIQKSRPIGNLAYILLEGYEEEVFRLTRKMDKLKSHDGIIWKDDLCLRKAALEKFVRNQAGYREYTATKIARELNDIGALVTNENDTLQVKLSSDAPRVYRILLDQLKKNAKKF